MLERGERVRNWIVVPTKSVLAGGCGEFPSNISSLNHVLQNPNKTSTVTWIVSFVIKVGLGIITFAYEL